MKRTDREPPWWAEARKLAARDWSIEDIACRVMKSFQAVRYALDEGFREKEIAAVVASNAKTKAKRAVATATVAAPPTAPVAPPPPLMATAGVDPEITRLLGALRLPPGVCITYVRKGTLPTFDEVRPS